MIDLMAVQPHVVSRNLKGYIIELYGEPKSGKTTMASKFENTLLLAFEKGYNTIPGIMAQPINSWTEFISVLGQLKKEDVKEKFSNICIDTVDIAYDLCEQYICQRHGVSNVTEVPFGKAYAETEKEYDTKIRSIIQLGYGVILISHAEEKTIKDETGAETTRIGPTLNKRGAKVINRMADIIGYIRPITKIDQATGKEEVTTYMFMRGNSRWVAGSRFKYTPDFITFNYDNLVNAIHDAIDKQAEESGGTYVTDARVNLYTETSSTKTFEEVMNEFNELTEKLIEKAVPHTDITDIIENILGKGKMVKDCKKDQQSLVELINNDLRDFLENCK